MNKRLLLTLLALAIGCAAQQIHVTGAGAQVSGTPTAGNCASWASSSSLQDAGAPCGSGSGSVPFVTPEASGAKGDGGFFYDGAITPPSMPANSTTGTSTTPTTPSITTPANNSVALYVFLGNGSFSGSPTPGTSRVLQSFSAGQYALAINDQIIATAGSTSGTATLVSSAAWVTSALALGPASGSSVSFVASANTQSASTGAVSVSKPTGTASGDMLIGCVDWFNGTMTAPTGWVQLTTAADGGGDKQACYYHVAGSSEPSSYTWSQTGSSGMSGAILTYSGVNTVSTLTSSTAAFTSASVNDAVCTSGTSPSSTQQCGTITAYNSSTSVDVSYVAGASSSNIWFAYGTDDSAAFTTMLTSAPCSTIGCRVVLQPKMYVLTKGYTLPPDLTIQFLGAGFGLGNTENSYLNGNTAPNANMGTRLDFASTSLGGAAITIGGTAGVTSTTAFDMLSDLAIYGGAGRNRDGGGGNGVDILNWQGVELNRVAVVNFSGIGVYADVVTGSSYKDYLEQIILEGVYALWNGSSGIQIGSPTVFANNIESISVKDGVEENNGGPGVYLAGKGIQGFTFFNNVIQWNNTASPNPEFEINWTTGANAVQACSVQSNYFEVDTNGGSKSSMWMTPLATGCTIANNFLAGDGNTGRTGINITKPLTMLQVNGSTTLGFDNTTANGFDVLEKATNALTAGQLVCLDTTNADSVIVCPTTTAAQMVGFADGAISAGIVGPVSVGGKVSATSSTTCALGDYVTASSTTAGDVACTATLPTQGLMVGFAETALGTAPGTVTVLIDKR